MFSTIRSLQTSSQRSNVSTGEKRRNGLGDVVPEWRNVIAVSKSFITAEWNIITKFRKGHRCEQKHRHHDTNVSAMRGKRHRHGPKYKCREDPMRNFCERHFFETFFSFSDGSYVWLAPGYQRWGSFDAKISMYLKFYLNMGKPAKTGDGLISDCQQTSLCW